MDRAGVLALEDDVRFAGGSMLPQVDLAVGGGDRQDVAGRIERHGRDRRAEPGKDSLLGRDVHGGIPQPDGLVVAAGGEGFAVGRVGNGADRLLWPVMTAWSWSPFSLTANSRVALS